MKENYVDRLDRNKTKNFDKTKIEAYTFAFQEAVQELQNRNDVDLRKVKFKGCTETLSTFFFNFSASRYSILDIYQLPFPCRV